MTDVSTAASHADPPRLQRHSARRPGCYWLNIGLAFAHKDGHGFSLILQAFPLDGKIVCREIITDTDDGAKPATLASQRRRIPAGRRGAVEARPRQHERAAICRGPLS